MNNKYYITTAIAYTSKKPHIGNVYEIILTDAVARYHRLIGDDVYFLTGTDEHGQKIEEQAILDGISPQEYVDKIAGDVKHNWDIMNTSYDQFIRTTDPKHKAVVQKIFKKLYEQGDIYKGNYEGQYCVACEAFYTETQLENGKCPDCGKDVKKTTEEAYFFKMSKYQDRLLKHIEDNPDFIVPESRKKEMVNNFLVPGLQDLCVSRTSFKWGIPVDFDPNHVVYVWIDALSNYITALGFNPDGGSDELFNKYWPCDVHIIGKDILRFHTIYWPIMLMALGIELPHQIFGHPWMLFGKDKMSKSTGNVIYADELVEKYGVDAVRYYVLSEMPYGQDGSITYKTIVSRINSDLANTLGNLLNRTVAMSNKYFGGLVENTNTAEQIDAELIDCCKQTVVTFGAQMDNLRVSDALDTIMGLARRSNKYIDETTPWTLIKDGKEDRLKTVLFNLIESLRYIGVMITPFMPDTAAKIFEQINCKCTSFDSLKEFGCGDITKVNDGTPLFCRIADEIQLQEEVVGVDISSIEKIEPAAPKKPAHTEVCGVIGIEDFAKVDLRVAKVIECEPVKKSDKLLRLVVNDGVSIRQVVSGIAAWYAPSDLIGKSIIVVANLKPVMLRGVESNGMILAADCSETEVKVIFVDDTIEAGSKVR